jgi:hypothetical protein
MLGLIGANFDGVSNDLLAILAPIHDIERNRFTFESLPSCITHLPNQLN